MEIVLRQFNEHDLLIGHNIFNYMKLFKMKKSLDKSEAIPIETSFNFSFCLFAVNDAESVVFCFHHKFKVVDFPERQLTVSIIKDEGSNGAF